METQRLLVRVPDVGDDLPLAIRLLLPIGYVFFVLCDRLAFLIVHGHDKGAEFNSEFAGARHFDARDVPLHVGGPRRGKEGGPDAAALAGCLCNRRVLHIYPCIVSVVGKRLLQILTVNGLAILLATVMVAVGRCPAVRTRWITQFAHRYIFYLHY